MLACPQIADVEGVQTPQQVLALALGRWGAGEAAFDQPAGAGWLAVGDVAIPARWEMSMRNITAADVGKRSGRAITVGVVTLRCWVWTGWMGGWMDGGVLWMWLGSRYSGQRKR